MADWNPPDFDFWLAFARRQSGLVRATEHRLMRRSLLAGLAAGRRRQMHRLPAHAGAWGRYEALKSTLTAGAKTPRQYTAACRRAARLAGV